MEVKSVPQVGLASYILKVYVLEGLKPVTVKLPLAAPVIIGVSVLEPGLNCLMVIWLAPVEDQVKVTEKVVPCLKGAEAFKAKLLLTRQAGTLTTTLQLAWLPLLETVAVKVPGTLKVELKLCWLEVVTLPPLTVQAKVPLPFEAEKVALWPVVTEVGLTEQVTGTMGAVMTTPQLALWLSALLTETVLLPAVRKLTFKTVPLLALGLLLVAQTKGLWPPLRLKVTISLTWAVVTLALQLKVPGMTGMLT